MRLLSFVELYQTEFELTDIAVYFVESGNGRKTIENSQTGRSHDGLVFTCGDKYLYEGEDGEIIAANNNDVMYLPTGSRYTHRSDCEKTIKTFVINFRMKTAQGDYFSLSSKIMKLQCNEPLFVLSKFKSIAENYYKSLSSPAKLKMQLYDIVLYFCESYLHIDRGSLRNAIIRPALLYLETSTFFDVKVNELASMCYISQNCFRKVFLQSTGLLPSVYIRNVITKKAISLLSNSDLSITEIAYLMQFKDVSSFSKFIKTMTGKSPSELRKDI